MKILIIEDEFNLADVIRASLKRNGYFAEIATNGEDGLYKALSNTYDLIILDVMLPLLDGFLVLKKLKEENITAKIIMLSAKSELEDKLSGLEGGADDYVTKPFHMEELLARVNIQLKKNDLASDDTITYGDITLNIKTGVLSTKDNLVELRNKEFYLLEYLISNHDIVVTREQLYDRVWGIDYDTLSNNLEAYLSFLRKKLKLIGSSVSIRALRGFGYKLEDTSEKVKE